MFVVPKENCVLPRCAVPGDVVTFTHDFAQRSIHSLQAQPLHGVAVQEPVQTQENTHGVPSNALVHRIRTDLVWDDVITMDTPNAHSTNTQANKNSTMITFTDITPTTTVRHFQNGMPILSLSKPLSDLLYCNLVRAIPKNSEQRAKAKGILGYCSLPISLTSSIFLSLFYYS
jgi:hypothetical protein